MRAGGGAATHDRVSALPKEVGLAREGELVRRAAVAAHAADGCERLELADGASPAYKVAIARQRVQRRVLALLRGGDWSRHRPAKDGCLQRIQKVLRIAPALADSAAFGSLEQQLKVKLRAQHSGQPFAFISGCARRN